MSEDKYAVDKNKNDDLIVNLSAGDNKIKYYECNNDSYIFEIVEDKILPEEDKCEICNIEAKEEINYEEKEDKIIGGSIMIKSIIDCGKHEILKGVKINLYKINGLSPILIKSKVTDENGEVVFSNIEEGSYRIIEIINKEFFEKPKYINWNEITINSNNKKEKILIVNKLKKYRSMSKHK